MLSVRDRVADHVLKEDLEYTARLLVDEAGDALHTAAACEAADGGLLRSTVWWRRKVLVPNDVVGMCNTGAAH